MYSTYWSLELVFLDKNLANQGFEDIIQISQFVDLAFSLRQKCVKTFCMHTLADTLATQEELSQNGLSISS